jgi:hypothetical protein
MCKCGCNTCETKIRGPLLTEGKVKSLLSENLQYHIDKQIPLFESDFRIGSNAHLRLIKEARKMYSRNVIDLCEEDEHLIKTHLGEFALYENESVPLDFKDGDRVKKVTFGDTTGLSAKIRNKEARTAFAARHDCKNKKDRTKASYWSCNLPRYATALGLGANMSTYW